MGFLTWRVFTVQGCYVGKHGAKISKGYQSLSELEEFKPFLANDDSTRFSSIFNFYLADKTRSIFEEYRKSKRGGTTPKTEKQAKEKAGRMGRYVPSKTEYGLFYETEEWITLSCLIKKIYGRKCMKCAAHKGEMHADHIIPRSKNRALELDIKNLQVLCRKCNMDKSNLDQIDYRTEAHLLKLKLHLGEEIENIIEVREERKAVRVEKEREVPLQRQNGTPFNEKRQKPAKKVRPNKNKRGWGPGSKREGDGKVTRLKF